MRRERRRSAFAVGALLLASAGSRSHAYLRWTEQGVEMFRAGAANVQFSVDPAVQPGLRNSAGQMILTAGSDPVAALQAALNTWNAVPTSRARFAPLWIGHRSVKSGDGLNVFSFEDTPAARSVVGSALAVTTAALMADGRIIDTDIFFNPDMTFSTTVTLGAFDLQSIATHELGHSLGAGHSPLSSATMFAFVLEEETAQRHLSADDIAFVSDVYPGEGAAVELGAIAGKLSLTPSGEAVRGALIVAVDPATGAVVGGQSSSQDGTYRIGGLPPGSYFVSAEPHGDGLLAGEPGHPTGPVDLNWQPAFYGGNASPLAVTVSGNATSRADWGVDGGAATLKIDSLDFTPAGSYNSIGSDVLPSGMPVQVSLLGKGFDESIRPEDILLLGPGISPRFGSLEVQPASDPGGLSSLFLIADVAPSRDWNSAVLAVRAGGAVAFHSGLRIRPAGPWFKPSGTVSAASYEPGGAAPGEIVSLFGASLGPVEGIAATVLDPSTGRLGTSLAGVAVDFDGVAAPLFYVSLGQINLQVPFEVAGRATTALRVHYGSFSDTAVLSVVTAKPAIFFGAVVNQDGTLNNTVNPAPRGSTVVVYGTGQGLVAPPLLTGQPAPVNPLSRVANVTASVGGTALPVQFAGMAPGFVGLLQVNLGIPQELTPGDLLPLQIAVDGRGSPSNTFVAVK